LISIAAAIEFNGRDDAVIIDVEIDRTCTDATRFIAIHRILFSNEIGLNTSVRQSAQTREVLPVKNNKKPLTIRGEGLIRFMPCSD
jgi:hypothetical protein